MDEDIYYNNGKSIRLRNKYEYTYDESGNVKEEIKVCYKVNDEGILDEYKKQITQFIYGNNGVATQYLEVQQKNISYTAHTDYVRDALGNAIYWKVNKSTGAVTEYKNIYTYKFVGEI